MFITPCAPWVEAIRESVVFGAHFIAFVGILAGVEGRF
jgi:hypothetical protein